MIREIILKYKDVGFVCDSFDHFQKFIDAAKAEDIIFTKYNIIEKYEGLFEKYTHHLDNSFKSIALIHYDCKFPPPEFQLYSRCYREFESKNPIFNDWERITMFNFSSLVRGEKLDMLFKNER